MYFQATCHSLEPQGLANLGLEIGERPQLWLMMLIVEMMIRCQDLPFWLNIQVQKRNHIKLGYVSHYMPIKHIPSYTHNITIYYIY